MSPLTRLLVWLLDRSRSRDALAEHHRRYLASLTKAARVLPGDDTMSRLIEDARRADEALTRRP